MRAPLALAATLASTLLACGGGGGTPPPDGGTGAPRLRVEPAGAGLAFGPVAVGSLVERVVTLLNDGTAPLHVAAVGSADPLAAPFSITSNGCSGSALAAGGSCTFTVRYEPTGLGVFGDSFEVASDDPDAPVVLLAAAGQAGPALSGAGGGTWRHYTEIAIVNQAGVPQPGQQVALYLAVGGQVGAGLMQASLADLRFTDASGAVELPHWFERWDGTFDLWATVKLDVPVGTSTIRMWFGNPAALPAADGHATFELFDDFEDGLVDPAVWTVAAGVSATEEDGYLKVRNVSGPRAAVTSAAYSADDVMASAWATLVDGPAAGDPEFGFVLRGSVETVLAGGSAQQLFSVDGATTGYKSDVELAYDARYWIMGAAYLHFQGFYDVADVARSDPIASAYVGNAALILETEAPGPVGVLASPGTEVWLEYFRVERRPQFSPYAEQPTGTTTIF